MEYVSSCIYSKYKILDNLMIYFYEYFFSSFRINCNETFPIFRSFEQLLFRIEDKKMKNKVYLKYEIY